jgi:hypothetical protein
VIDLRRLDLLSVENWNAPQHSSPGTWPCGSCGRPHRVIDSWLIHFRDGDGRTIRAILACGDCAERARGMLDGAPDGELAHAEHGNGGRLGSARTRAMRPWTPGDNRG